MQENNIIINITGRHIDVTDSIKEHVEKKINSLHYEFPKIVSARAILDVQNYRHFCEIILNCANHITIEASSETQDLYASIDETISKIDRRMRKYKTRFKLSNRKRKKTIRHFDEEVYSSSFLDLDNDDTNIETTNEVNEQDYIIQKEKYTIKPIYPDEAILELELSDKDFTIFENQKNNKICIVYRKKNSNYGLIEIN